MMASLALTNTQTSLHFRHFCLNWSLAMFSLYYIKKNGSYKGMFRIYHFRDKNNK